MKNLPFRIGLILACVLAGVCVRAAEPARPNILYFYVDDMGWGSIGPNGQAERRAAGLPAVRTPNLDRLAAEGVNFTRGYGCHVCSPARSSLQIGFHQGHTFADRNDPDNARKAIRADDISIGTALSDAGYVTGYWGKWGYGGSKDQIDPVIDNVQTLPTSHGYRYVLAELHHVRAHTFFQPTLWHAPATSDSTGGLELIANSMTKYAGNDAYPNEPALQNHGKYPETAYCDDMYSFAALDFVRRQGQNYRQTGQPFLGILAVQIPHAPFDEISQLPEWDRAYKDDSHFASLADQSRQWAAMVTRIDAHFGNVLAALEDPNQDGDTSDSIVNQTLVIFQSDNGGPGGRSHAEYNSNGGLSGVKGKIQEGGIRVPLVMRWPDKIHPHSKLRSGSQCDLVVDVTDLLPTFCELAGAPIPVGIDGVSIAPTLLGQGHQRHRDFIIHEASNGQSIIHGNHKLVRSKKSVSLYDLAEDPAEANDIAGEQPQLVQQLQALLLGERVTEPKGFANTYHDWTGNDGAATSHPDHWSDYQYANAGITYLQDDGPPRLSWIARVQNLGQESSTARVDRDLRLLGVEIRGNAAEKAKQYLSVGTGVQLTGRNEIRLSDHGTLRIGGGEVTTLRWVDIYPGGTLSGFGTVRGIIYNQGRVEVTGGEPPTLRLHGDYHQEADGILHLALADQNTAALEVDGRAILGGTLKVTLQDGFDPIAGQRRTVLSATRINGKFANDGGEVICENGVRFKIEYTDSAVSLIVREERAR